MLEGKKHPDIEHLDRVNKKARQDAYNSIVGGVGNEYICRTLACIIIHINGGRRMAPLFHLSDNHLRQSNHGVPITLITLCQGAPASP